MAYDNIANMTETFQFVSFRAGQQLFGVEIHSVIEVISLCEIAPLPGAPPFMEGMIDLRGQILPVVDLRKRLGIREIQTTMQTRILILRMNSRNLGLIVDQADQVYTVPVESIQSPPEQSSEFVLAVARYQKDLFVILDLERLLNREEQMDLSRIHYPNEINAPQG
jgi:purine-binding chemotaxis protein CheW